MTKSRSMTECAKVAYLNTSHRSSMMHSHLSEKRHIETKYKKFNSTRFTSICNPKKMPLTLRNDRYVTYNEPQ